MSAPAASQGARARLPDRFAGLLGGAFDDEARAAFGRSVIDSNNVRLRVLLPLMAVVHVAHTLLYWVSPAERATLAPTVALWRDGVVTAHLATLVLNLALAALAWLRPRASSAWLYGPAAATLYLVHGAACSGVDQLVVMNVTAFTGYAFGIAVIIALTPWQTVVCYGIGLVSVVGAVGALQPDVNMRTSALANAVSLSVAGVGLAVILHGNRRRDFAQRRTIDRQRQELQSLNAVLERRVREQVAEIVQRADEVDALNTQLQARVRDRSNELSLALAQLASQREADGTLKPGTLLAERFEIVELLGQGGMGAVYAGVDRTTSARVAVKVIQAASARQLDALHRFLLEARSAATIAHAAVVRVLHVDISDDGLLFQVQELVDGETLEGWLRRKEAVPAGVVARVGAVLCEALAAAHEAGVIHRDVKPSNVMLTSAAPHVKLLDFGIAKLSERHDTRDTERTGTGFFLGTPAYMAPEQKEGAADVTDRADVYAVGVVLFRMLTRRLPTEKETARARGGEPDTAPDQTGLAGLVDAKVAHVVGACLTLDPAARPSARVLAAELAALAEEAHAAPLTSLDLGGAAPALESITQTTWQRRT